VNESTTDALIAHISTCCGVSADNLEIQVGGDSPDFADGSFLDREIVALWPRLPVEARLIAYALANDRAAEDTARGERDL
jgi:hypothetical protein